MSRIGNRLPWRDWTPGLDHDDRLLGDVLDTLPGAGAQAIPWIIRLLENPASPLAFPGAIALERHDCLHVLLGRGLLPTDEGFVIGFTMGGARAIRGWQLRLFKFLASRCYPRVYRFCHEDRLSFDLGVAAARACSGRDFHLQPLEQWRHLTVAEVQRRVGINSLALRSAFRLECLLLPESPESRRLDHDLEVDPSAIAVPDGPPSDWRREPRP